ncbi:hypothetical protein GCM10022288_13350 [Gryllotalpicola kribbensis]|uniref:Class I SAM-dependent methyltransferase n=1 Tax=Gryllotalpicola kribbensis TaxID=993084 RepID=A0ABP8AQ68_9MICO
MIEDHYSTSLDALGGRESWIGKEAFWLPTHFVPLSGWNEHGPFLSWLMARLAPRTFVELGSHYGYSYFTACDAVKRLGLPTETWAVDSWEGDEHAGFYGDEVFESVRAINESEYVTFSTLVRGYFDAVVDEFADGSIDLLHVDGRHRYEDVKHDFETYLPKLSTRSVVLFHDIAEHQSDFGVWRYWEELSERHPSFAFEHGHGLGVLGVGAEPPESMTAFFAAAGADPDVIRTEYSRLGRRLQDVADWKFETLRMQVEVGEQSARLRASETELDAVRSELASAREDLAAARAELERTRATLSWRVGAPLRALRRLDPRRRA